MTTCKLLVYQIKRMGLYDLFDGVSVMLLVFIILIGGLL